MSFVFTNALVRISTSTAPGATLDSTTNGEWFNVSNQVSRVRLQRDFEEHDDTHMGLTARSRTAGLETWAFELEMLQGFDNTSTDSVDYLLDRILAAKVKLWVTVRTCNGARSSDNPEYNGPARLFTHAAYDGEVGDLLKTAPAFRSAGNLVRSVSAS